MGADARMPGRYAQPWCPSCHGPAGIDCPDSGKDPRSLRRRLARDLRREAATEIALRRIVAP